MTLRAIKNLGKRVLPASWIYAYHSIRITMKLGMVRQYLRVLVNGRARIRLGGEAGWNIPAAQLNRDSTCYCVGCGEDITFDLEVIERFGCTIHAFDPTPRAVAHVRKHASHLPNYRLEEVAIWETDTIVKFYVPSDQRGVSHSITNLEGTDEYIEVPARRLKRLLEERGHARLDLMKMDIEGAEHAVIWTIVEDGIPIDTLCVEFDGLDCPDAGRIATVQNSIKSLRGAGFEHFWIEGSNFTFVRKQARAS